MEKFLIKAPHFVKVILINIYGFILAKRRFSGSFKYWLKIYKKNLYKTPEAIKREQFELLKSNLIYAFEYIPYYKRVFNDVGFDPYTFKSEKEMEKIPYLTKEIIRKEFENLYIKKISSKYYHLHTTSGSTGEKLKFLLPKELSFKKNTAFLYRFYAMWGIQPKDKRVTIGGRVFTEKAPFWVYNFFEKQLLMSAHHLSNETVKDYVKKIEKFNPIFIQGHPSAIVVIAKFILEHKVQINVSLKAIFTTGETLVGEDQELIELAFGCKVAQQYGSGENCFSAQQAPNENGYLINYEHGFIELVGDGELKEVVVTSLQNNVMPFIRYKMNDFVKVVEPKNSEQFNLPILFDEVIGRTDDIIVLKDGNTILPVTVRMNIKPLLHHGTNYQLIQINENQFNLHLFDPIKVLDSKRFLLKLNEILGEGIHIDIFYVDSLVSAGGKIRNVIRQKK